MSCSLNVGFIGSGNICQAIVTGAIKAGNLQPSQVKTSAPSQRNFGKIQELGVATTHDNCEVTEFAQVLFLACKPYQMEAVTAEILPKVSASHLVVSCAAGVPMEFLESWLPSGTRVIRIIPNMACSVGEGGIIVAQGTHATTEDVGHIEAIFRGVGQCFQVPDRLIESASGILGCGIAMMSVIAEGLSDGGMMMGISKQDAVQMTAQLLIGVGKILKETGQHPGEVKDSGCSPNGTSIRGVQTLERGGIRGLLMDAVEATVKQSKEMSPK